MDEIKCIYLTWRKGRGHSRHIIGIIKRNVTQGVRFRYIKEAVREADKDGFKLYPDFPEVEKEYTDNVVEIFGQRLINLDRSDSGKFKDFWALNEKFITDRYYLLAHTQGWLTTDSFEFLADFFPIRNLKFVTDLAGLSTIVVEKGIIRPGEQLSIKLEPNNIHEPAVSIWKEDSKVGYIKKIHNRVFYRSNIKDLKVTVKAIEENERTNRIFVLVSKISKA